MAQKTNKSNGNDVVVSALSYILVGLIWYALDESVRNDYTKYHLKQGIVLLITCFIASAINSVLVFIPFFGWIVMGLINLFLVILVIVGIINSLNTEKKPLPVVGKYALMLKF